MAALLADLNGGTAPSVEEVGGPAARRLATYGTVRSGMSGAGIATRVLRQGYQAHKNAILMVDTWWVSCRGSCCKLRCG